MGEGSRSSTPKRFQCTAHEQSSLHKMATRPKVFIAPRGPRTWSHRWTVGPSTGSRDSARSDRITGKTGGKSILPTRKRLTTQTEEASRHAKGVLFRVFLEIHCSSMLQTTLQTLNPPKSSQGSSWPRPQAINEIHTSPDSSAVLIVL